MTHEEFAMLPAHEQDGLAIAAITRLMGAEPSTKTANFLGLSHAFDVLYHVRAARMDMANADLN